MSSTGPKIDELITRHEDALKRIEELKGAGKKKVNFSQRLAAHWRVHGNTLSGFIFAGCFAVLASNLISERREHEAEISRVNQEKEELARRLGRVQLELDALNGMVGEISQQAKSGGNSWICPGIVKIRNLIKESKSSKDEVEVEVPRKPDPPSAPPPTENGGGTSKKFMI
ncbi:hypothetical protein BSKO_01430 [Bryopsis sp. KO-2023]|nr:hypothetical protein BSKO_01430 [Bryopsis sp. KO-2023]